jgi:hypothetical protein
VQGASRPARLAKGVPDIDVDSAEQAYNRAQRDLEAFRQKREADDLAERIRDNDLVLGILAPDGLRAKKLARILEIFNRSLEPLCQAAEWRPVLIDAAMTLTYGGRPYMLLSTSEQYRVRAVLQVRMAQQGSEMVVIDEADILDGTMREGLFAMIAESGLSALVCMTLSRRAQMPDLAAAELGASYWIEDGIALPMHHVAQTEPIWRAIG